MVLENSEEITWEEILAVLSHTDEEGNPYAFGSMQLFDPSKKDAEVLKSADLNKSVFSFYTGSKGFVMEIILKEESFQDKTDYREAAGRIFEVLNEWNKADEKTAFSVCIISSDIEELAVSAIDPYYGAGFSTEDSMVVILSFDKDNLILNDAHETMDSFIEAREEERLVLIEERKEAARFSGLEKDIKKLKDENDFMMLNGILPEERYSTEKRNPFAKADEKRGRNPYEKQKKTGIHKNEDPQDNPYKFD